MAKKSLIAKEYRKIKLVNQQRAKRLKIKADMKATGDDIDARLELQTTLNKMPRNASAARITRRCRSCGRPRSVYRKFGLCRLCLRKALMNGDVPGGTKASW